MKRAAAVGLAAVWIASAAQAETPAAKIPDLVENRTFGFRVSNPEKWPALKNPKGNLVVLSHPEKPQTDFVTVNVEDLSKAGGVSLSDYRQTLELNLRQSIEGFALRGDEPYTIDERPAHQMIYTGRLKGRPMRWKTIFTLNQGRAYVLTYTAEEDDYFKNLESADKILYSFRFL